MIVRPLLFPRLTLGHLLIYLDQWTRLELNNILYVDVLDQFDKYCPSLYDHFTFFFVLQLPERVAMTGVIVHVADKKVNSFEWYEWSLLQWYWTSTWFCSYWTNFVVFAFMWLILCYFRLIIRTWVSLWLSFLIFHLKAWGFALCFF